MKATNQITAYTFSHAAGTITFTGYTTIHLGQIVSVFNVTRGVMLFNVGGGSGLTGTVATNVLTLAIDTSAMADTDQLLIYYNDATVAQIVDGSAVTQPVSIVSGSVTSSPELDTTPPTQNISAADTSSTFTTIEAGQIATIGTPSVNSTATFALASLETAQVQITGTWVGTLVVEVSMDGGTTWYQRGLLVTGTASSIQSFTANGQGQMNVAGITQARVRATAWTSGTATVKLAGSLNASSVFVANSVSISDPVNPGHEMGVDSLGRITVNAGSNISTALLALESGGNLATVATAQGVAGTGLTQPTGGSGIIGMLSGIYHALLGFLFDGSGNLKVNVEAATTVPVSGTFWQATQPVSGTFWQTTQPVSLASLPSLAAGTALVGDVGNRASASGGWSSYFANALKATVQTISSAAGKFAGAALMNTDSAPVYLQIFDTTGSVTLGTTTPTMVIPYLCNAVAANGAADRWMSTVGANIANGIKAAATTTATGSTASTNGLTGTIWYK